MTKNMTSTEYIKMVGRVNKKKAKARFYNINSILGNNDAIFYVLVGSRMTGKSYAVSDYIIKRHLKLKENCKNYWLRISESSTKALLANKASKLVDPDLQRYYNMNITQKAGTVYNNNLTFCEVYPLSSFAKLKGVGFYDKDYKGEYNIVLDEFQLEIGEKRTSFDILYNFIGMIENIARTTKDKIKVFLIANNLEEAGTIMKAFDFVPIKFGRYYLKRKRCVIDFMENSEEYEKDRKGSIADILGGSEMSNFTNKIEEELTLLADKRYRLTSPLFIIKFQKKSSWYTVWKNSANEMVIRKYKNESARIIPMKRNLGGIYNAEEVLEIIEAFDKEQFKYKSLSDKKYFEGDMKLFKN